LRNNLFLALVTIAFALNASAHGPAQTLCRGFLPENELKFPILNGLAATGLNKSQFDSILDRISAEYSAEISARGAKFQIERKWKDATANAYAYQDSGVYYIAMYGGLARHPAMTEDGFLTVACHELGHHLGGAPKITSEPENPWASVEGQSDYYSSLKCLRRMFLRDDNAKVLAKMKLDPIAVNRCRAQGLGAQDENICIRSAMAGVSLATVLGMLGKEKTPRLSTPDPSIVFKVYEKHPRAQCRMDTFLQGALCRVPFGSRVSDSDYRTGTCDDGGPYAEGKRPRCWF
jgi:hypothetical protein